MLQQDGRDKCCHRKPAAHAHTATGTGGTLQRRAQGSPLSHLPALAALGCGKTGVADASIASLPPTLQHLDVDVRGSITSAVRFAHLVALVELACSGTRGGDEAVASLQALGAVLW